MPVNNISSAFLAAVLPQSDLRHRVVRLRVVKGDKELTAASITLLTNPRIGERLEEFESRDYGDTR